MKREKRKKWMLERRHRRVRGTVRGEPGRPRLAVHRTHLQIYAQVIDDMAGRTLCASSSLALGRRGELGDGKGCNVDGARAVGADIAKRAQEAGISAVAFDRGGHRYHGRVKALAEAAREGGLQF
jgi:large subunit ribosomal protein L18